MRARLVVALIVFAIPGAQPAGGPFDSAQGKDVTFARDVAPVIFEACGACHRPEGPAPFSLLTYQDAFRRARQIADVTKRRFMPPWKVEPGHDRFVGQRHLSDAESALIARWVEGGASEGDPSQLPAAPRRTEGWQLGTPDLIVTIPEAYTLSADGTDVFRIFAIRVPIEARRYVRGLEFQPGNARVVHHANIRIDYTPATRELDARDTAPGYDGLMPRSAVYPDGHFLGWTPGQLAPLVPGDLAWRLEPGADLVVQLHMQPSGRVERVRPSIGLFFSREPPTRSPSILRLGSQGIDIAPGDVSYTIADSYVLPVDVELHAVQPHAHYRARHIAGDATLPDGTTRPLIRIRDWDFRWQHVYRYETPLTLPKGTTLSMRYTYDNSAANPDNPQQPPARVSWGQRSFDEMGDLWFQMVPQRDRDLAALNAGAQRKMMAEDIVGYETMIRANPADAELHDDVALLYLELGKPADAVRHFEASLRAKPSSAAAHFNLATALTVGGRLDAATGEYRKALAIDPAYARAHTNLGMVLASQGAVADATRHLREAVRLDPANLQARAGLAAAHASAGAFDLAIEEAEAALALRPAEPLAGELRARLSLYRQRRRP